MKPLEVIGTQRSLYTHRKNRDSKKVKAEMQAIKRKAEAAKETKKEEIEVPVDSKVDEEMEEDAESVTLILVKLPALTSSGFGTRYQLIAPEGYGLNLLRRFIYSGCKAIGIKETLSIHLEAGQRCFPYDFPETPAGRHWQ